MNSDDKGGGRGIPSPAASSGPLDELKMTRRAACMLGAGLSASALFGLSPSPGLAAETGGIRYVVTDRRHPQSLEFGEVLARRGARPLEVTEGLTRLWQEALLPLWREEGGQVAGITRPETWACIAEQARSSGRRSILVGHHDLAAHGEAAAHLLTAPRPILDHAAVLETCGTAWPQVMAVLASQCRARTRPVARQQYRNPAEAGPASTIALTSWIIA